MAERMKALYKCRDCNREHEEALPYLVGERKCPYCRSNSIEHVGYRIGELIRRWDEEVK